MVSISRSLNEKRSLKVEIIIEKSNAIFKYHLSQSGDILLHGNSYKSLYSVYRAILSFKNNIADPYKYAFRDKTFALRAGNHREIGHSPEMKPEALKEAMALLMKYGADAPIVKDYK